jgi:hypothetical protein
MALAALLATAGCARITPWSVTVQPPPQTLVPASAELLEYTQNAGLSLQFERTTRHCGLVRQAIAREMDQRNGRSVGQRRTVLVIGSAAALATTIYSGTAEAPKKQVLVPLGTISGGSLLTALPMIGRDERADALAEKLGSIRSREAAAMEALREIEQGLLAISLLRRQEQRADSLKLPADHATRIELHGALETKYREVSLHEDKLREALVRLAQDCS